MVPEPEPEPKTVKLKLAPAPAPAPALVKVVSPRKSEFKLPEYTPAPPTARKRAARYYDEPIKKVGPSPRRIKRSFAPQVAAMTLQGALPDGYAPHERAGTPGGRFQPVRPAQLSQAVPAKTLALHGDGGGVTGGGGHSGTSWHVASGINTDLMEYDRFRLAGSLADRSSRRPSSSVTETAPRPGTAPDSSSSTGGRIGIGAHMPDNRRVVIGIGVRAYELGPQTPLVQRHRDPGSVLMHPAFDAMQTKAGYRQLRRVGGTDLQAYEHHVVTADTAPPAEWAEPGAFPLTMSAASDVFLQAANFSSLGSVQYQRSLGPESPADISPLLVSLASARSVRSARSAQRDPRSTVCYQTGHDGVPSLLSRNGRPCSVESSHLRMMRISQASLASASEISLGGGPGGPAAAQMSASSVLPLNSRGQLRQQMAMSYSSPLRIHAPVTTTKNKKKTQQPMTPRAGIEAEGSFASISAELPQRLYQRRCVVPGPSRGFSVTARVEHTQYINL